MMLSNSWSGKLPFFVLLWYTCNTLASYLTKQASSDDATGRSSPLADEQDVFPSPSSYVSIDDTSIVLFVSLIQLILSSILGLTYAHLKGQSPSPWSLYWGSLREDDGQFFRLMTGIAMCNAVGLVTTNIGYLFGSVSLVQLIKAMEPVATFVSDILLLKSGKSHSLTTFSGVVLVIAGAGYASCQDPTFNTISIVAACISNAVLPLRNIFVKYYDETRESSKGAQENRKDHELDGFVFFSLVSAIGVILVGMVFLGTLALNATMPAVSSWSFMSALAYYGYNAFSFSVLRLVDPVLHAVLNVIKRAFVIVTSMAAFGESPSLRFWLALFVMTVGLFVYQIGKGKINIDMDRIQSAFRSMTHNRYVVLLLLLTGVTLAFFTLLEHQELALLSNTDTVVMRGTQSNRFDKLDGRGDESIRHEDFDRHVDGSTIRLSTMGDGLGGRGNGSIRHGTTGADLPSLATPAVQSSQQYMFQDVVAVPLEPYNACGDRILHVSCLKTIIIDRGAALVPTLSSLYPQLCKDLLQQTNDPRSTKQLDNAHCMLCLQVHGVVSALAKATKMKDTINRYLLPTDASRVAAVIVPVGVTHRIVDRKTIEMRKTYLPFSLKHNTMRRQDESNYGNIIWQYGATRLINPFTTLFKPVGSSMPTSALVMATANALFLDKHPTPEDEKQMVDSMVASAKKIRSGDVPTIMLGIGIQKEFSSDFKAADLRLFDYQKAYLHEIEKRQSRPGIAVRGNMTRIACENSGLSHCITMGCPSLTINTVANLGATIERKWKTVLNKLADGEKVKMVLALPAWPRRDIKTKVMDLFVNLAKVHDVVIILQDSEESKFAKRRGLPEHARSVDFNNVEEWFNLTANVDLVLTACIHGGMAGIAGATPTVVIPMDFRMQELVDAMLIPSLPLERVWSGMDLGMVLRKANVDFKAFEANRRERLLQYIEKLRVADLEINPKLLDVVEGSSNTEL